MKILRLNLNTADYDTDKDIGKRIVLDTSIGKLSLTEYPDGIEVLMETNDIGFGIQPMMANKLKIVSGKK